MSKDSEPTKEELEARIAALERIVERALPSRRQVLKGLGVLGAGGISLAASGSAGASTGDATQIGTPSDRPTIYADDIDANALTVDTVESHIDNGTRIVHDVSELQRTLNDAADAASADRPQAVHLVPDRVYDITETITVPRFVTLYSNAAILRVQEDRDIIRMDGGSRQDGVLKIKVHDSVNYSSDALKISAVSSPTTPIARAESNVVIGGPVTVVGSRSGGAGLVLEGGDTSGKYVTHCYLNVVTIAGFDIGIDARSGAKGNGFLNSNKVPNCTFLFCNTAIRHTGASEAKVLIGGHIQGSNVDIGVDSSDADVPITGGSVRFDGHFEDVHQTRYPVRGGDMKITTRGGISNWNSDGQNWSGLGLGTTIDGFGYESSDAVEPHPRNWRPGDMVIFQNTADGSGSGLYVRTAQWQMAKISDAPPQPNNNSLFE
ncbi:hypothetical protein NDI56_18705 [Haloarcula sp. S1CR25-12]|uniref:Right-handed parallel beta-helix repeat-containing protein n=1 Tax=Haloarcula saliterrae TaxID=2950534 RepID=A0ABU2FI22_9EURY|nr:hypothetical protein [Haloarcula sp. S1CR25-12]MDS0261436.1 hypothetical protein [Haloarcula sp. S1CR25-12]